MPSPTVRPRLAPEALDSVFDGLRDRVAAGDIPAAALAVGDAEGGIRSETFAARPRERIDPQSNFFLASLTKPIVATAAMQLVEAGSLDLHEPIARHLPQFATAPKDQVTLRHLLTHTSGVYDIPIDTIRRERPSAARMTQLTMDAPLNFAPGTRWEYCSSSFYLIGLLIEKASGLRYPDYLRQRLFEPLGMQTTFDPRGSGRRLVRVHGVGADNRLVRFLMLRYLASIAVPGGGLWGTLDDLLRFGAASMRPRATDTGYLPLSPATAALMMEDHVDGVVGEVDGETKPVHFGLGWGKPTLMREVPGSPRVVSHGGATGTRLWIDPDHELVFVFFTNQWDPNREPEIEALAGTYRALARG